MTRPEPEQLRRLLAVYAITPTEIDDDVLIERVDAVLRGGVRTVQIRDKRPDSEQRLRRARGVLEVCRAHGALCIVNDDVALTAELKADGVHLGPGDMAPSAARALLGERAVIGGSAGDPERAVALVRAGVDYLGVGAIFDAHATKPDASAPRGTAVLRAVRSQPLLSGVPLVAIGGIEPSNVAACIDAGADGVALVRGLFSTPNAMDAAAELLARVTAAHRALA